MSIYLGSSICLLMLGIKSRLIFGSISGSDQNLFLGFFIPLAFMNVIEITFYFESYHSLIGLKLYYVCALCSIGGALFTSLKITESDYLIGYIYSAFACTTSILFIFSNKIIDGYMPFLLTITANRAELYYIWQATALMGLLTVILINVTCLLTNNRRRIAATSFAFLLSISIPLLLGIIVILSMAMGLKINATIWLPISTTLFMLLSRLLIRGDKIYDIRGLFNMDALQVISRMLTSDHSKTYPLKDDIHRYEKILIQNSLNDTKDNNGHSNCNASAKQLKVSETTIRRKRAQYKKSFNEF